MSPDSRWWIAVVPAGAMIVGTSPLYGSRFELPPVLVTPLAVGGLVAAACLGVRRARSFSLWARLRGGCLWAALWVAVLPLPAALRSGLFLWGAHAAPAPAGATYFLAPGDGVEYGLSGNTGMTTCGGYQVVWRSELSVEAAERFYRQRLPRAGWRLHWARDLTLPPGTSVSRMICFRRADGYLTLRVGAGPDGKAGFGLLYDHFGSPRQYR